MEKVGWGPMLLLAGYLLTCVHAALPPVIRMGALFLEDDKGGAADLAFKYAVFRINQDQLLLPNTKLTYDSEYVRRHDAFHTAKKACRQVSHGVHSLFGPPDPMLGFHIQSLSDVLHVPHIEARIDYQLPKKEFSLNLHPRHALLNHAFADLMRFLNWTKVALIYEEDISLIKLQDVIRGPKMQVYLRQASRDGYRHVLADVKRREIFNLLVDTKSQNVNLFLRAILQLQMNDHRYHYIFTSFDIETWDLDDFRYNKVNITAFRLVDSSHPHVQKALVEMERLQPYGHNILNKSGVIEAQTALMYDAVFVFANGLQSLERTSSLSLGNISCDAMQPWSDGKTLFNFINAVEMHGLTGPIRFFDGNRHNFKLDLLKLQEEGLLKVGQWTPKDGINITNQRVFFGERAHNVTLIVTTIPEEPYVMMYNASTNRTGDDQFYGFCIDLLKHISKIVGFNYKIKIVEDGKYGVFNPETNEWNGMVRELMDKKADMAVAAMTINHAREKAIDFTKPFMNLGISILFKVPSSQPTRLFSFMNPLAIEIWLYVLAAYVLVSFTMFVMARFSPFEWNNPHPCNTENDVVENQFTVSNGFWFIAGILLGQGSGHSPKAGSTRLVGAIWWFFTLIIISSYTANLAAFLTVERMITPIENADDLADQEEIAYGTLEGGSTMTFFRDSKIPTYQTMWEFMENRVPSVFVPTYEAGVKRVLEGNYAFLMESTMLDYIVQRNCNLTQVGGLLDSKGYGIGTPMNSPWRDKISLAILELQEKGIIPMLYNKWWKNTGNICNRDDKNKESSARALGKENIGGVFVVLLVGLACAIVVAILEFCWISRKNAITDRQSLMSEMTNELRFALRCYDSHQRPALRRECPRCVPTGTTYVPTHNDHQLNGENGVMPMLGIEPGLPGSLTHRRSREGAPSPPPYSYHEFSPPDIMDSPFQPRRLRELET